LEVTPQETTDELSAFARNYYSQWGEDGVIAEVFKRIGTSNKWCLECGAGDGLFFSNTRRLIEQGWTSVLVEADVPKMERLTDNSAPYANNCFCYNVTIGVDDRLDDILASCSAPTDIDLAVIDIDGQDFYAWNAMLQYRPRVVIIEYDPLIDPDFLPTLGGEGQAGLHRITELAYGKSYRPIWKSVTNMMFVSHPLEEQL
jgi:hypothetical protein